MAPPPIFMKGSGALSYTNYALNSKSNPYLAAASYKYPVANKHKNKFVRAQSSYGVSSSVAYQSGGGKRKRDIEQVMQKAKQIQL